MISSDKNASEDDSEVPDDSSDNNELKYRWSQVLSLSYRQYSEPPSILNSILKDDYIGGIKNTKGRPVHKWDYVFSPKHFDAKIDISQLQAKPLSFEDMQQYGIVVSLIR